MQHQQEQQPQQQVIGKHPEKSLNGLLENTKILGEHKQEQQQQEFELQFTNDEMSIGTTKQAKVLSNHNDQVRLAVKRRLSYPDDNVTIKRPKKFEHEIDCNRQVNFSFIIKF